MAGTNGHTAAGEAAKEDSRLKRINAILTRYARRPDALIEVLHQVQESYGYVPREMMILVSKELCVPPSKIYGVVTFYHFFSTKPKGEHTCVICTGTACHVKGAQAVMRHVEQAFDLKAGFTTADGKLGLQTARCLGCCSLGPVAVMDDEILAKVQPQKLVQTIKTKLGASK